MSRVHFLTLAHELLKSILSQCGWFDSLWRCKDLKHPKPVDFQAIFRHLQLKCTLSDGLTHECNECYFSSKSNKKCYQIAAMNFYRIKTLRALSKIVWRNQARLSSCEALSLVETALYLHLYVVISFTCTATYAFQYTGNHMEYCTDFFPAMSSGTPFIFKI